MPNSAALPACTSTISASTKHLRAALRRACRSRRAATVHRLRGDDDERVGGRVGLDDELGSGAAAAPPPPARRRPSSARGCPRAWSAVVVDARAARAGDERRAASRRCLRGLGVAQVHHVDVAVAGAGGVEARGERLDARHAAPGCRRAPAGCWCARRRRWRALGGAPGWPGEAAVSGMTPLIVCATSTAEAFCSVTTCTSPPEGRSIDRMMSSMRFTFSA